jgi:hypothetical protein
MSKFSPAVCDECGGAMNGVECVECGQPVEYTTEGDNMPYKWMTEEELPDGHRLFGTNTNDGFAYAIADDSGKTPDQTEDGVLWLDSSRCLIVDKDESFDPPREHLAIPVIDDNGKRSRTPSDMSTLLHLANMLGWQIEDQNVKAVYEIR